MKKFLPFCLLLMGSLACSNQPQDNYQQIDSAAVAAHHNPDFDIEFSTEKADYLIVTLINRSDRKVFLNGLDAMIDIWKQVEGGVYVDFSETWMHNEAVASDGNLPSIMVSKTREINNEKLFIDSLSASLRKSEDSISSLTKVQNDLRVIASYFLFIEKDSSAAVYFRIATLQRMFPGNYKVSFRYTSSKSIPFGIFPYEFILPNEIDNFDYYKKEIYSDTVTLVL